MKSPGLLLTAILAFAVGAAWTVHLSRSGQSCPRPSAASVTMLFDPCQAYDEASATISPVPASDVDGLSSPNAPIDRAPLVASQDHATVGVAKRDH
jgi:hypothetical protein